jgi:5'-3' exonuclease
MASLNDVFVNHTTHTPNYLLIDGSYYCFYRYYAIHGWWRNAMKDTEEELGVPIENTLFREKFEKMFVSKIHEFIKKCKIDGGKGAPNPPTIYVAKDCHRVDIWRNKIYPDYKKNRTTDDAFMRSPFFELAYNTLFEKAGCRGILYHPKLEADDCIAIAVNMIIQREPNATITIITGDNDYLQLAKHPNLTLYNLQRKKLTDGKQCTGDPKKDLFCKIVCGDKSDDIPSVFRKTKCGIKTALKLYDDREIFDKKLAEEERRRLLDPNITETAEEDLERNKTLVNFDRIPRKYIMEFINSQPLV